MALIKVTFFFLSENDKEENVFCKPIVKIFVIEMFQEFIYNKYRMIGIEN